jgi:hypothetical protein
MLGEAFHLLNAVLAISCMAISLPALTQARDNAERLYLAGAFALLVVVVGGSLAQAHAPITWRTPVITAACLARIAGAWLQLRQRRRISA